jgi:hypothetical protein
LLVEFASSKDSLHVEYESSGDSLRVEYESSDDSLRVERSKTGKKKESRKRRVAEQSLTPTEINFNAGRPDEGTPDSEQASSLTNGSESGRNIWRMSKRSLDEIKAARATGNEDRQRNCHASVVAAISDIEKNQNNELRKSEQGVRSGKVKPNTRVFTVTSRARRMARVVRTRPRPPMLSVRLGQRNKPAIHLGSKTSNCIG